MMRSACVDNHQPALDSQANRLARRPRRAAPGALLRALALAAGAWAASCAAPPGAAAQAPSPAVTIPGFFDLAQRQEKPDLAGLRVIRFMTDDDYPPMNFLGEDGRLTGFNVDLARAICDLLNVGCTIQARRWDTLLDALKEGRGDAVIASVRPTPALRAAYAFSAPYLRTPARFVGRKDAMPNPNPEALAGRPVAVVAGSAHEAFLKTFFPGARPVPLPDVERARAAMQAGKADAVFADGLTLALWLNTDEGSACCAFAGGPYTESRWFGEGVAIAMRPGEPVLRRAIDFALQRLAERGTYAELYLRWFPVGFY